MRARRVPLFDLSGESGWRRARGKRAGQVAPLGLLESPAEEEECGSIKLGGAFEKCLGGDLCMERRSVCFTRLLTDGTKVLIASGAHAGSGGSSATRCSPAGPLHDCTLVLPDSLGSPALQLAGDAHAYVAGPCAGACAALVRHGLRAALARAGHHQPVCGVLCELPVHAAPAQGDGDQPDLLQLAGYGPGFCRSSAPCQVWGCCAQ